MSVSMSSTPNLAGTPLFWGIEVLRLRISSSIVTCLSGVHNSCDLIAVHGMSCWGRPSTSSCEDAPCNALRRRDGGIDTETVVLVLSKAG